MKQGNQLITERVERLEIGMTRDQVQFLLDHQSQLTLSIQTAGFIERIDFDGEVQQNNYLIINFKDDLVFDFQRESGGSPSIRYQRSIQLHPIARMKDRGGGLFNTDTKYTHWNCFKINFREKFSQT